MTELKSQVCSLEHAKKLKELGVKQESLFYWYTFKNETTGEDYASVQDCTVVPVPANVYAAFTVAELGEIIPYQTDEESPHPDHTGWGIVMLPVKAQDGLRWFYREASTGDAVHAETEADARAAVLIDLIENNLISTLTDV